MFSNHGLKLYNFLVLSSSKNLHFLNAKINPQVVAENLGKNQIKIGKDLFSFMLGF